MQLKLLSVKVDNLSQKEIATKIKSFLNEKKSRQIATINPEIILKAQENDCFEKVLNDCDLNVADGIGIKFAFWRFGKNLKHRWSGIDLMWEILEMASKKNIPVFLLANKNGLSTWRETAKAIQKKYPNLRIFGINLEENNKNFEVLINQVTDKILFCNFGAPSQETIISALKKNGAEFKVAMGVGGSFDFITGKIKRAPRWVRFFGFEWLWRLFQQPHRIKRIINAVLVFPVKIIFYKDRKQ